MLAKAIAFASEKHVDQVDRGGKAYILHPLRMMMRLRTSDEELMAIAVLHDVVEDCSVSEEDLYDLGMSKRVVEGVMVLTKRGGETYSGFIDRVLCNRDAMLVKREDLRDNSDLTRLRGIGEKDVKRMNEYMVAFNRVEEGLKGNIIVSKPESVVKDWGRYEVEEDGCIYCGHLHCDEDGMCEYCRRNFHG